MKLSINQENLKNSLNLCSHFISPRAHLPILGNIYLKTNKSKLILSSTNLETSVSTTIGAKIEEDGEITIPGKIITEIISNLSPNTINLEVKKEVLTIESGSFKSKVTGMNASDFPAVPTVLPEKEVILLNRDKFIKALSKCGFAVSSDETRPVLTGILIIFKGNKMYLVATDGFRLSQVSLDTTVKSEDQKVIIPKAVLSEIAKTENKDDIRFSFNKKDKQVLFGVGDSVFSSRIIEGEFPDFEKIIPKSPQYKINFDKNEMEQAVRLASVFAREAGNIIKLRVMIDKLLVSSESSNSGTQSSEVEAKVETDTPPASGEIDLEIAYNFRFIEEFLKSVEGDTAVMEVTNSNAAGKFLDPKNPNFLHLIMPIKIAG